MCGRTPPRTLHHGSSQAQDIVGTHWPVQVSMAARSVKKRWERNTRRAVRGQRPNRGGKNERDNLTQNDAVVDRASPNVQKGEELFAPGGTRHNCRFRRFRIQPHGTQVAKIGRRDPTQYTTKCVESR